MKKKDFTKKAGVLKASLNGKNLEIDTKKFSTGSVGWHHQGKVRVTLADGSEVEAQAQISLQVVGSKELGDDDNVSDPVEAESETPAADASKNGKVAVPA